MKSHLSLRPLLSLAFTIVVYYISYYILFIKEDNVYNFRKYHIIKDVNLKKPPSFIAHIGSLHLSSKKNEIVQIVFNNLTQIIKPSAIIISGSITDGISDDGWYLFSQLIKSSSFDPQALPLLATAGKEDHAFLNSPSKFYTNFFNISEFDVFSLISFPNNSNFDQITDNVKVTVFNPLTFPFPPYPQSMFSIPSSLLIKKLDDEINPNLIDYHSSNKISITTSSYPIYSIIDSNHEFMTAITNTDIYLSGNSFIDHFQTHIYNQTYEFVAAPLSLQTKIGLLTDDNSILSYNTIDFSEDYLYVLSNPSCFHQIGTSFRIRLIVFETHKLTLVVEIDGHYRGRMETDFITDNYRIYGMNIKLNEGEHNLFIDGDISINKTFYVGEGNYTTDQVFILRNQYAYEIFNFCMFLLTFAAISFFQNILKKSFIYFIYFLMLAFPIYFTWKNGHIFIIWTWGFLSNLKLKINSYHSNTFPLIESLMIIKSLLFISKTQKNEKGFVYFLFKESSLLVGFLICFYCIYIYGGLKSVVTSPMVLIFILTQIHLAKLHFRLTKAD